MASLAWTEDEVAALRADMERGVPRKETAGRLGRSLDAVNGKVTTEGLSSGVTREDAATRLRWKTKLPMMRAAIREAVEQSA